MEGKIDMAARRQVTNKLRTAYAQASKRDKGLVLAELMATTGMGLAQVSLGPAERAEIVVAVRPDEKTTMHTVAGDERINEGSFSILELRAAATLT